MVRIAVVGVPDGWSTQRLAEAAAQRAGPGPLLDMDRVALDLSAGALRHAGEPVGPLDAVIIKKIGAEYAPDHLDRLEILRWLEESGTPIFSRPSRILRLFNRISCTVTLRSAGVPMPDTVVTANVAEAEAAVAAFGRAVCKPIYSTKARGMVIVEADASLHDRLVAFQAAGNPVFYIQRLIALPGRDLGVVFLGGEYLATYARVAKSGEWNTTTRSGGRYVVHEPSPEVVETARRAEAAFDLDFTCVDVAETEQGPVVFEVSAFGGFRGLRDACGIDAAEKYVDYVLKQLTPS